jgi:peptidoglycan/xylan/chitin deacetylase (PgdA/CDA1 family)
MDEGWLRHRLTRVVLGCGAAAGLLAAGCSPAPSSAPAAPPPPRLVVSVTFNDGLASQYDYARPVLDAHGMRATFYLASGWLDAGWKCCLRWWQVDQLYRDGHEIGGMGRDHEDLTAHRATRSPAEAASWPKTYAWKRRQVCADRELLLRRGYDPRSFAYPEGAFAAAFPDGSTPQDIVRGCGYLSARAVGGLGPQSSRYAGRLPPVDPYALRTPDRRAHGPIRLTELKDAVTAAVQRGGGWLPLAFDQVCHLGAANYRSCMASPRPLPDTTLSAFLDWLAASGRPGGAPPRIAVKTVRAALGAGAQPALPTRRTIVSLTFDNGTRGQYAVRSALLDRRMHATFYISSSFIDRADGYSMSWSQVLGLAHDGNDVGGNTVSQQNLRRLSGADKRREICGDRGRLVAARFDPVSFSYPFGAVDTGAEQILRSCGYRSARTSGGVSLDGPLYAETVPPRNPYATRALDGEDEGPIQLSYLESAVEMAARHGGGWIQIVFRQVCRVSDRDFGACMRSHRPIELTVLQQFLDWLTFDAPASTSVRSVREVLDGR